MSHVVDATYENGMLKPDRPLPLTEREKVRLTVERFGGGHSVLDIPPVSLGNVLVPSPADDDLLGEMLAGRA
jgi:AF2212-like